MTDGLFRDPETGRATIYARPNAKIKAVGVLVGAVMRAVLGESARLSSRS